MRDEESRCGGKEVDADASDYAFKGDCGDIRTFEERKGVSAGHRHPGRGPFIGQSLFVVWAVVQTASADRKRPFPAFVYSDRGSSVQDPGTLLAPRTFGVSVKPLPDRCTVYARRIRPKRVPQESLTLKHRSVHVAMLIVGAVVDRLLQPSKASRRWLARLFAGLVWAEDLETVTKGWRTRASSVRTMGLGCGVFVLL